MELDRDSRIIRWAYLAEKKVPMRTSLCAIFWRVVLLTPLKIATWAFYVVGLVIAIYWVGTHVITALLMYYRVVGQLVLTLGLWVLLLYLFRRREPAVEAAPKKPPSVLWLGAKAVKQRVCPIVTIKETTSV